MADASNDDPEFGKAIKLASRSYNELEHYQDPSSCPLKNSKGTGAGRKLKAPEGRVVLFHWFVDVRESVKGGLPRRLFKLKEQQLYAEWLFQNPIPENKKLKFSNKWIKSREKEHGGSMLENVKQTVFHQERRSSYKALRLFTKCLDSSKVRVDPPIIRS